MVPDEANIYSALCTTYNSKLSVESGGGTVHQHEEQDLQIIKELEPSRATFSSRGQDFFMGGHKSRVVLSSELHVWNAVIIRVINAIENNIFNL